MRGSKRIICSLFCLALIQNKLISTALAVPSYSTGSRIYSSSSDADNTHNGRFIPWNSNHSSSSASNKPSPEPTSPQPTAQSSSAGSTPKKLNKCFYCYHMKRGHYAIIVRKFGESVKLDDIRFERMCDQWLANQPNSDENYIVVKKKFPFAFDEELSNASELTCSDCDIISTNIIGHGDDSGTGCKRDFDVLCAAAKNKKCSVCSVVDSGCSTLRAAYSDVAWIEGMLREALANLHNCGKHMTWSIKGNQRPCNSYDWSKSEVEFQICVDEMKIDTKYADCAPDGTECYFNTSKYGQHTGSFCSKPNDDKVYEQLCEVKRGCTKDGDCSEKNPVCCPPGTLSTKPANGQRSCAPEITPNRK